jgi:predicted MFS family arabinose efflux permease
VSVSDSEEELVLRDSTARQPSPLAPLREATYRRYFFGAGAVLAAFVAGAEARRHHRRVAILLGVVVAGLVVFAFSPWLVLTLAGVLIAGFGYLAAQTRTSSLMYRHVALHERGRVMALWSVAFIGVRPVRITSAS